MNLWVVCLALRLVSGFAHKAQHVQEQGVQVLQFSSSLIFDYDQLAVDGIG